MKNMTKVQNFDQSIQNVIMVQNMTMDTKKKVIRV